jgi:uncharacterized membrane protein YgcG
MKRRRSSADLLARALAVAAQPGLLALILLGCLAGASLARADERILSYDSTITVQPDGALDVHEIIRVRSEGRQIRRGIFRDFPTIYPGRDGSQVVVGFDFRGARRDGSAEPWHTENRSNGLRIYLGSADVMLPSGEHTYEIDYRTDHQLGFFADHDELYWNVTGNGWDFAIESASARVILPPGIPRSEIRMEGYTGPQGARGADYTATLLEGTPSFTTTQRLRDHEGLTIVVMWPKGFVTPAVENTSAEPSRFNSHGLMRAQKSGLVATIGLGGLTLLLLYYIWAWNKVGRDPPGRIAIPEYEPPPGISPGGMRYLLEWSYDDRCFAADVLNLAVKGHLVIDEDRKGLLGLGKTFTLIKQSQPEAKPLSAEEQSLLASLFSEGDRLELKKENHRRVRAAKGFHRRLLTRRYSPSFFRINGGWHGVGVALSLGIVGLLFLSADRIVPPHWFFASPLGLASTGAALAGLLANGVFGKLLKAPTVSGRAIMDRLHGFKMYLAVAEGEELKRVNTPPPPLTPELYHAYLPAAIGLGVEQRWGERFAAVFADQSDVRDRAPGWYSGSSWDGRHLGNFSRTLGTQLNGAISSASTAPGSQSGGGGGGSSGGGGGGGGGGGW